MGISLERNLSCYRRVVLGLLAVALLGLLLVTQACTPSSQSKTSDGQEATAGVNVGEVALDFTLIDLEGNQVTLSDFRGKTVFINFWATRCPPCRAEMPEIEAVYQEYKDKDVVVIGVHLANVIWFEPEDKIRQFVQQGGYNWIFVTDTSGEVSVNYKLVAIPTSFFIDREGIIRTINIGPMTKRAIESKLAEAMR